MRHRQLPALLHHLYRVTGTTPVLTDRELLERFVRHEDKEAFTDLVRRHGPRVLALCQSVLRHEQDAEDAFQATFLVLARKAASTRWHDTIGNWLHEVATRLAREARSQRARRQAREARAAALAETPDPGADLGELCALLHEEVARLPVACREPILLCCFEGRACDQAAQQLGCSLRTLERRLQQGRDLLRLRLARSGHVLSTALLAASMAAPATAAVPPLVLSGTVEAAAQFATGGPGPSEEVVVLAEMGLAFTKKVLTPMTGRKLIVAFLCLIVLGVSAAGLAFFPTPERQIPPPGKDKPKPPIDKEAIIPVELPDGALARLGDPRLRHTSGVSSVSFAADRKLLASCGNETGGGGATAIRIWEIPSGREVRCIWLGTWAQTGRVALSPDGKLVAWSGWSGKGVGLAEVATGRELFWLHPVARKGLTVDCQPFAFAPDSKTLATGGDGSLRLWDLDTGKEKLQAQVGDFDHCLFSPHGRTLAIVDKLAGLRLIDIAPNRRTTGQQLPFPVLRPRPNAIAFSPDGEWLAACHDNQIQLWDVDTGKEVRKLPWQGKAAVGIAFSPDGRTVIAVARGARGGVHTWEALTGKEVRTFQLAFPFGDREPAARLALAFSPDLRWLAASTGSKVIRLVDLKSGQQSPAPTAQPGDGYLTSYAFSPDGRHLVTPSNDDRLLVWEARSGKLVRAGTQDTRSLYWLAFTPDGTQLISMSYNRALAEKLRLEEWDFATCKQLRKLELDIQPGHIALSPDGRLLACGEANDVGPRIHKTGDVVLLDRTTCKEVRHLDDGIATAPRALIFSPDGDKLATVTKDGTVRLWEVGTGKLLRRLEVPGHSGLTYRLGFSDGGRGLMSVSQTYGKVGNILTHIIEWDLATGKEKRRSEGPRDIGWCQALSPDGKRLVWAGGAWAGRHETVEVWDVAASRIVRRFEGLRGGPGFLLFAPDGRTLASGAADDTILIWDFSAVKGE